MKRNPRSIRSRYQISETFTEWPMAIKQTRRTQLCPIKQLSISSHSSPDACFPYPRYPGTIMLFVQMSRYKKKSQWSHEQGAWLRWKVLAPAYYYTMKQNLMQTANLAFQVCSACKPQPSRHPSGHHQGLRLIRLILKRQNGKCSTCGCMCEW